jgi:aspartyl-tRNA(Asn)/glutamyl-tRNA(Gln) amidotransferase subunit A
LKNYRSYNHISKQLTNGGTSCVNIVKHYLQNIKEQAHLNAFLEVFEHDALKQAEKVDAKIKNGTAGKLAGMVVGIKDVLCFKDHAVQASSKILDGFESQFTGTAVQRLIDADAIIIGRLNCDEFAMGSSNENSAYGPVLNADDNNRVPGGSSGGCAVAVQANLCTTAIGSDTGGSVRQPASFCGVVGLKPTYSRISRFGLLAYASSFDVIGTFTNNIEDSAIMMEVMSGSDDYDSTVSRKEIPTYSSNLKYSGKAKIGFIKETLNGEGLNEEVKQNFIETIEVLKEQGHQVDEVSLPLMKYALPTYYILITAEASSNLSRYDGVRYGYRSPNTKDMESMYKKSRSEGFGEEVRRRIMLGTFVLSASYYDAFYTKAQKVRFLIKEQVENLLSSYDFLIMPTSPTTAFKLGEHNKNPLEMYLADLFTVQASVAGVPAISVPNGKDQNGMAFGLQIMANFFEEEKLLAFSNSYLKNDWTNN